MIVDYTFFQDGLLRVDGALALATPSPTNEAIAGRIDSFIERYEPEYMCKLLGEELYNDFLGYENGESVNDWSDFMGIIVKGDTYKTSPIANYVYFHLLRASHTDATMNGVKADGDNGRLISPERKMIFAWNDMVQQNRMLYRWLEKANFKGWDMDCELLETISTLGV